MRQSANTDYVIVVNCCNRIQDNHKRIKYMQI
jgi:hypothetical protein